LGYGQTELIRTSSEIVCKGNQHKVSLSVKAANSQLVFQGGNTGISYRK